MKGWKKEMMKKGKKLLSIVMSSIMVLSAFAEGDYTQKVYADENDKAKTYYSSVKQYVYDEKNNKVSIVIFTSWKRIWNNWDK